MEHASIQNLYPRDSRVIRAVRDVLNNYKIKEKPQSGKTSFLEFQITGGLKPYQVKVSCNWETPPVCTCPDHFRRAATSNQGYCKHIIAVLLSRRDLICQLLDIFL